MKYNEKIIPIVREVRAMLLPSFGNVEVIDQKSVNPGDVVTQLDRSVETFLKEKFAEVYPEIGFVGEEHGGDRNKELFWLVDPIDGTGYFVRGIACCTTMVALIDHGQVIFSIIYDFVTDTMYWAEKGMGAFMNKEPIHVSDRGLKDAYISFETHFVKTKNQIQFAEIEKNSGYICNMDSGWDFAMVACGKFDARLVFDAWGKDYDFAPGTLLVSEAGGKVVNIGSDTYDYKNLNFIAANPKLCDEIHALFENYEI